MHKVGVEKFDNFFDSAGEILGNAEDIRGGLQDSKETMEEIANVELLKEPSLVDAIQAWIWSLSANEGGEIKKSGLEILEEKPYIQVDCSSH